MEKVYSPGCALLIHKPHLAEKVSDFLALNKTTGPLASHIVCCKHDPGLKKGTQIINTCAGCDRRFRGLYEGVTTVSLWEIMAENDTFVFPNYGKAEMSIHDACPTRSEERVHNAVRKVLKKMNIRIVEPTATRTKGFCCGDSFYGSLPVEQVKEQMKKRADSMPREEVVVYCISCIKSMHIGGKKPRYLLDLVFGESTEIGPFEPEEWHGMLDRFIEQH